MPGPGGPRRANFLTEEEKLRSELKADADLNEFRSAYRIAECDGQVPEELKQNAKGICRIRDGYTVLLDAADADPQASREASLEEIMVHLEREEGAL